MKKAALYSPSPASRLPPTLADASSATTDSASSPTTPPTARRRTWAVAGVFGLFGGFLLALGPSGLKDWATGHAAPSMNMRAVEAALRKSLEEKPLLPPTLKAAEIIAPSVVRVLGLMNDDDDGKDEDEPLVASGKDPKKQKIERGVGTGVVIIDNGTILTNLHVLQGAKRIKVTFADGHVSDATLISADPKNDLAVLRARSIPDDLQAAAMRSTGDLAPGEPVVAVGFPFGIGPSTSAGVVSGLKREFRSPDGQQVMTNLIQFDAAANPGNSGGPLVTLDGAVVGIVTAILNPSQQRVFIGIGFAVPIENAAGAAGMPPF
ncbi:MAG: S1C family serine protease [Burkholderiales bacterium]